MSVWFILRSMFCERDETPEADAWSAVAEVIRAETIAFQNKDFDAWAACFVHNDDTHDVLVSNVAGLTVLEGWPAVASHMKRVFREGLTPDLVDFGQENMRIKLVGDLAWAVFDSWSRTATGANLRSFDVRILRRVDGQWKIVFNSFVQREVEGATGHFVGVDGAGDIVWASQATLGLLDEHPLLRAYQGKLRARRPEWDGALQVAITQSGNHHGFFETHRVSDEFCGPAQYPVVLGRTDFGGVAVIQLSIRDCVTYVRISGEEDLERRLRFAKTVFGLSPGQLRIAREIALGESLRSAANKQSISVTTARTHLSRIYTKTGVRTQAALVRLLLSIG